MLEMREREGSGVLRTREGRAKWSREASKHSAQVGASQARRGGLPAFSRRPVRQNSVARVETPVQQCTIGLTANNDHTSGAEGLSGPHCGRVPQTGRQNSSRRKTVVSRRFTGNAQGRFTKRAGRALTSTAGRRRLERRMQHSAV